VKLKIGAALVLAVVALFTGCAKRTLLEPARLDTLRTQEDYTLVHTVAAGETLRSVAELYYGDPERAGEIAAGNALSDPDRLDVGDDLILLFSEDEWAGAERRYRARVPYNHGVDAFASGRLDVAGNAFREAARIDPTFDDAAYNLALVELRRGRNEAAEDLLADLRMRRPEDVDVLVALGNSLFYQTRFGESAEVFRDLLVLSPDHRQGTYGLAQALTESGMVGSAIRAWEAYLKLDSQSSWSVRAREQLKTLRGR
jgi:tetratricopeptide (TPR) repeat protein